MFVAVRQVADRLHLRAELHECARGDAGVRAVRAVDCDAHPGEVCAEALEHMLEIAVDGNVDAVDLAAAGRGRNWEQLTSPHPPAPGPLVITHGDPGPGNYLDNGHSGTLIDWEEAQVAPRGLDLARAMFIALLGSGLTGFVARDHHARARSVASGYLASLQHTWAPGPTELRWWLTAAGMQFAHRRLQRAGQPGVLPWTDAITVLATALRDDRAWMPDQLALHSPNRCYAQLVR